MIRTEIDSDEDTDIVYTNRVLDIGVPHTAKHLFFAVAYNGYGVNTVGFRVTETYTTVDLDA